MYRRLFLFNAPKSVSEAGFKKVSKESSLALMGGGIPTVWLRPWRVTSPMLLLASGHDYFFPERNERRTAKVYGADFKIYPDMGHNLMIEQGWEASCRGYLRLAEDAGKIAGRQVITSRTRDCGMRLRS